MKDLENQLVKHVINADGDTEMLCEACNCLSSHLQTNTRQGALLTAQ